LFCSIYEKNFQKGVTVELIRDAISIYDHEVHSVASSKSTLYVESFLLLKEYGFEIDAIKEALIINDSKFEPCLDYLTK
jgi:hypothetical protein